MNFFHWWHTRYHNRLLRNVYFYRQCDSKKEQGLWSHINVGFHFDFWLVSGNERFEFVSDSKAKTLIIPHFWGKIKCWAYSKATPKNTRKAWQFMCKIEEFWSPSCLVGDLVAQTMVTECSQLSVCLLFISI